MGAVNTADGNDFTPRILVFSTTSISDIGIDLAGSSHMHYPPSTITIPVPCSSCIRPEWILHAIRQGFDGVIIAADGPDCQYLPDCTKKTSKIEERGKNLLRENNIMPERLKMVGICSVCAEPFVNHTKNFFESLKELGPAAGAD